MNLSGELHAPVGLPLKKDPVIAIVMDAKWSLYPVWTCWGENKDSALQGTVAPSSSP
jgi:hypothetical protein